MPAETIIDRSIADQKFRDYEDRIIIFDTAVDKFEQFCGGEVGHGKIIKRFSRSILPGKTLLLDNKLIKEGVIIGVALHEFARGENSEGVPNCKIPWLWVVYTDKPDKPVCLVGLKTAEDFAKEGLMIVQ